MQAMDWHDLHYILAVSRAGTLSAAARRLAVNQTTVARRLAAAEHALGTRLFDRVAGALRPTRAGGAAIAWAARVEAVVLALGLGGAGGEAALAGSVRLTAGPVLINRLLAPALPAFLASHPGLRRDLAADPRNASLTRREADIALRLARPEEARGLLTRRLGHLDYAVYGLRRRSAKRLPWITYDEALAHLPHARWLARASEGQKRAALSVNDTETLVQVIHAGLGKSLLPCFLAGREAGLRRLSGARPVVSREVWLLTHRELRHQARIDAVVAWLAGLVKAQLAF